MMVLSGCSQVSQETRTFTSESALAYFKELNGVASQGTCPSSGPIDTDCETSEYISHKSIELTEGTTIRGFEFESPFSGQPPTPSNEVLDGDLTAWCFLVKPTTQGPDGTPADFRYDYPCYDMSGFGAKRLGELQDDGTIGPGAYSTCLNQYYRESQREAFNSCVELRQSTRPTW